MVRPLIAEGVGEGLPGFVAKAKEGREGGHDHCGNRAGGTVGARS
jgi:hypothetical protein